MSKEPINRINQLAQKAKTSGLTEEEKNEQQKLRRQYIDLFKSDLKSQLENVYIVDKKGNKQKLGKKPDKPMH